MKKHSWLTVLSSAVLALLLATSATAQTRNAVNGLAVITSNYRWLGTASAASIATTPGSANPVRVTTALVQYMAPRTVAFEMTYDFDKQQFVQGQVYYATANCTGTPYAVADGLRAAQMLNQVAYVPHPWAPAVKVVTNSTRTAAGCTYIAPPAGAKFIPVTRILNFTLFTRPYKLQAF